MTFEEVLQFRRSVRVFDSENFVETEKVKKCIEQATLAPNSSNMQLWEFYHITDKNILQKIAHACFNQTAATTAQQMVVFVTRQDLYKSRAKEVLNLEIQNILKNSPEKKQRGRIKVRKLYYGKLMPFLYVRFFGIIGWIRKIFTVIVSLFRPIVMQTSENDIRVVVHKSCGLAAQTFMMAMANEKYDTCPMEGFDSRRVKQILQLPFGAEINMIVSCGIRKGNEGIWGDRMRIPFEKTYKKI